MSTLGSGAVPTARPKPPLLYNPKVRGIAYQVVLCVAIALLAWLSALAAACFMLERLGVHLLTLAPELKALNAALLTLPLTLFLCTIWCYDRLRHR